jgi:hypothetical protein
LADKVAICPAIGQVERAVERVAAVPAIELTVELVPPIGPAAVELIA